MFALPFSYFLHNGYITVRLGLRLSTLFALGAGQGLVGWWMVKSGLEEPASEYSQPRVSPYRLAAHLTSAFAIYCGLFWTGLSVVMPKPLAESVAWIHGAAKVKRLALPISLLVGLTAVSGAFVTGNDAGHAFNTFPKMGDTWIPDDIFDEAGGHRLQNEGTVWNAVAHIITGVIGAGVLSLAWCVAQLGWVAGPLFIILFAATTFVSTCLLCDCYRFPDPDYGITRIPSYMDAVKLYLGETRQKVCGILVHVTFYGTGVAYVITSANSIRAILKSNCYHKEGHDSSCYYGETLYMVLFGLVQVMMSFIPDLHNMAWVSVIAAIMSFTYSSIGLGLGIAKVIENGRIMGSITGVPATNIANKLWFVFQALGDIAFAYPYSVILLEIQDTLESPPPENQTMKKASMMAILITTFFYLCCGCFGYAAFGNDTPGNLLTGFGFYEPYWLVDLANACIVLHLVGGYQIFSQPLFNAADRWCSRRFPNSGFVNYFYKLKLPLLPSFKLNLFRVCFRTAYVISTTGLAILFPYFNQVLGVLGALNFWPLAIYFPVEMYFVQNKIGAWTRKWVVLRTFSFACFLVSVVGLVGSLEGIISEKLS